MNRKALRIIAVAPNQWDGQWMNRQQLLSRLATHHHILYTNGPFRIWDRTREEFRRATLRGSFELRGAVIVDRRGRLPLRVPRIGWLDRVAIRAAGNRWRSRLSFAADAPLVAYLFHPSHTPLLAGIRPDLVVYHAYDLFRLTPNWSVENERNERQLLDRANVVLASSREMAADLEGRSQKKVGFLPNGVDYEAFAGALQYPEPPELAAIRRPRIGYIGKISIKFDFDLILELSQLRPDWQLVIVGQSDDLPPADAAKLASLRKRANVHMIGFRQPGAVARFTAGLDVGIMCYRLGDLWTRAIYPLKLHEYLACGLPVVSAPVPAVREFAEVVRIAQSPREWLAEIAAALEDRSAAAAQRRQQIARANSWDDRVAQLDRHLDAMVVAAGST